jgi:hypothetical protein
MKKVFVLAAIALSLTACGGGANSSNTSDSTAVDSTKVDSAVVAQDTTTAVAVDSTATK